MICGYILGMKSDALLFQVPVTLTLIIDIRKTVPGHISFILSYIVGLPNLINANVPLMIVDNRHRMEFSLTKNYGFQGGS